MQSKLPVVRLGAKLVSNLRLALLISILPVSFVAAQEAPPAPPAAAAPAQPAPLDDEVTEAQQAADTAAAASQEAINETVDATQQLSTQYAQALAELDSFNQYNSQLQEQVDSQEAEIASIQTQLVEIETTNREVMPLMERMVVTLEQFVAADIPFLIEERTNRVNTLKDIMTRTDVAISEKYRRILEAYQIELDYGRTLSAYNGPLEDGRTVQFVQLGRVSLMYQTLDGTETGYWDASARGWVVNEEYTEAVRDALSVARQEGAPDLLRVPVPAPQEARQ